MVEEKLGVQWSGDGLTVTLPLETPPMAFSRMLMTLLPLGWLLLALMSATQLGVWAVIAGLIGLVLILPVLSSGEGPYDRMDIIVSGGRLRLEAGPWSRTTNLSEVVDVVSGQSELRFVLADGRSWPIRVSRKSGIGEDDLRWLCDQLDDLLPAAADARRSAPEARRALETSAERSRIRS